MILGLSRKTQGFPVDAGRVHAAGVLGAAVGLRGVAAAEGEGFLL